MTKHQVLTIFLTVLLDFRAQKRIAQQRIDSRIPLGKLIDLRKKIFANVKVRDFALFYIGTLTNDVTRASRTWARKLVTSVQYLKFDSPPIAKFSRLEVGRAM